LSERNLESQPHPTRVLIISDLSELEEDALDVLDGVDNGGAMEEPLKISIAVSKTH
jgi:hypothetical protein